MNLGHVIKGGIRQKSVDICVCLGQKSVKMCVFETEYKKYKIFGTEYNGI